MMANTLLIVSIFVCTVSNILPFIAKYIISWLNREDETPHELMAEIAKLEYELIKLSMVDEFAKCAKIQRKQKKLKETIENDIQARERSRIKTRIFFTYAPKVFNAIVMIILIYMYRAQPIIVFSKGTLWPLNGIISWPGNHEDSISFFTWMGMTNLIMSRLFSKINVS